MKVLKLSNEVRKAVLLGTMCAISYLAVYVARNVLSTVTPQIIENGVFSTEEIGTLSSVYFITYALGQLINGISGDRIKAKYMIAFGLILAGVCNVAFAVLSATKVLSYIAYALTGFFLSMIYAPMTKLVAENTEPIYATRCSLGYTFASFFGSPVAGVFAAFLAWEKVFSLSSAILIFMGVICFIFFTAFEKRGLIKYGQYKPPEKKGGIKLLIKHQIIKFTLISIITGVVRTAVVFWLPTYLSQRLGFTSDKAALIFTVATFVISETAFLAVFMYEKLNRNMDLTLLISFVAAAVFFLLVFFVKQPVLNIVFMVLAIMFSNCAASMLWSRYCPSLRDTGMVSSATGFLDFVSYIAAAVSSALFANAVNIIGWGYLILIWFALMVAGIIISLPFKKLLK